MGKYAGWIMLFAVFGTLSAVAAIAISEAFVPSTLLVLTVGEWELVAVVFYILAILLYLGESGHMTSRGVIGLVKLHRKHNLRGRSIASSEEQHDAAYGETLQAAEA